MLYSKLKEADLLYWPDEAEIYGTAISYYSTFWREAAWAKALDEDTKQRYALCMDMNSMKFALAAECLRRPLDKEALSAAVCFVFTGCLLDNLVDCGSPTEREQVLKMLEWKYCAHYFVSFGPAKSNYIIDVLFNVIARYLKDRKETEPKAYDQFLAYLRRAIAAEATSLDSEKHIQQKNVIMDKSVLFEVLGFQLAFFGANTRREWDIFFLIGNIFRIIDDLCDEEDDAENGQINSLLSGECGSLEQMLAELTQALERLKQLTGPALYHFIRYEVRCWTLDNPYLYQKAFEVP